MSQRLGHLALYALVAALLSYSWMPDEAPVPNEQSRVYLAIAVVDHGAISIDAPMKRFGKINDRSRYGKHWYTDKAPGSGFLAAGVYGAARLFTEKEDWTISGIVDLVRTWLMIPLGLLGFFLLRRVLRGYGVSPPAVDVVSLSYILGSVAFHYGTAVYGHQISAVLLLSILALRQNPSRSRAAAALRHLAVGLAAGLAGFTEYQSALWCLPVAAAIAWTERRRPERLAAFAAGAGAFVVLLLLYNRSAYGDPLSMSYHHLTESMQGRHSAGIAGVTFVPSIRGLFGILLSGHRGLLATSPIFALSFPGLAFMWRRGQRELALIIGASFAGFLLFVSSAAVWHGGWAYGPRLLVPVLGALAIPAAFTLDRLRERPILLSLSAGLGALGILCFQLVHLVAPELPHRCFNPMLDIVVPAFGAGVFTDNLFSNHLGVGGIAGVACALVLTAAAVAFVIVRARGIATKPGSPWLWIGGALAVIAVFAIATAIYGHSWTPEQTRWMLDWIAGPATGR